MNLITTQFNETVLHFTQDAYFNATEAAALYGKRPVEWLRLEETKAYLEAFAACHKAEAPVKVGQNHFDNSDHSVLVEEKDFVVTVRGGENPGTWLHPSLAVAFARWLDPRFGVWCDHQIHLLLTNRETEALKNVERLKTRLDLIETDFVKTRKALIETEDSLAWNKAKNEALDLEIRQKCVENLSLALSLEEIPLSPSFDDCDNYPNESIYSPRFMKLLHTLEHTKDQNYLLKLGKQLDAAIKANNRIVSRYNELNAKYRKLI